jgi:gamma-glutamylcyclotransferase (GGCT)/AIG2-like uncharacterized protein YtfP
MKPIRVFHEYKALFVYGTMLSGESNHRYLKGATPLGVRRTEPRYLLVDLGPYPALMRNGRTAVTGELYLASAAILRDVDRLEGCPTLFQRASINLLGGEVVDSYLLVRAPGLRPPKIRSGDWREHADGSRR